MLRRATRAESMSLSPSDLHVVAGYSNHRRYQVRPRLLKYWLEHMLDSGVSLTIVQHTLGERAHDLDPATDPNLDHVNLISLRGGPEQEIWLQHGLYNVGISRLPDGAKWVAWMDTDVWFSRKDWAIESLHMLQHYRIGQPWATAVDLDPNGNVVPNEWGRTVDRSFSAAWREGHVEPVVSRAMLRPVGSQDSGSHTGYCWVIRRDVMRSLGKLLDWLIAGLGDYHMALGFCGRLRSMVEQALRDGWDERYSPAYYRRLLEWAARCDEYIKQDIGVVEGTILHSWHGSKKTRFYGAREEILTEAHFDPDRDVGYDVHGLPMLVGDNRILRDGLRRYGVMRSEDSIDVY
jgi:hypothetical protein